MSCKTVFFVMLWVVLFFRFSLRAFVGLLFRVCCVVPYRLICHQSTFRDSRASSKDYARSRC